MGKKSIPQRKRNPNKSSNLGAEGEKYADKILSKKGYVVLERNYRNRFGEIDLVAVKDDALVFVEVKTRSSTKYGLPEEAVSVRKLKKIMLLGEFYKKQNPGLPEKLRVDIFSIIKWGNKIVSHRLINIA